MTDTNECNLTGSIDRLKRICTRTGAAMAEIILMVRQDRFRVVAHGNVAEHILSSGNAGERLSITGSLSVSNWKDEATSEWRNSFAVTAWGLELQGEQVAYQRKQPPGQRGFTQNQRRDEIPVAQPGDPF